MESGLSEDLARDQVCRAFHLVVQISRERMGRRVVREITELERVLEGEQQRHIELYKFDPDSEGFYQLARPSGRLIHALSSYGVNYDDDPGRL